MCSNKDEGYSYVDYPSTPCRFCSWWSLFNLAYFLGSLWSDLRFTGAIGRITMALTDSRVDCIFQYSDDHSISSPPNKPSHSDEGVPEMNTVPTGMQEARTGGSGTVLYELHPCSSRLLWGSKPLSTMKSSRFSPLSTAERELCRYFRRCGGRCR